MESLSNQNIYGSTQPLGSKVELTLFGIDKKWVRSNGSWTDKSKLPVIKAETFDHFIEDEEEKSSSKWWQFWKS